MVHRRAIWKLLMHGSRRLCIVFWQGNVTHVPLPVVGRSTLLKTRNATKLIAVILVFLLVSAVGFAIYHYKSQKFSSTSYRVTYTIGKSHPSSPSRLGLGHFYTPVVLQFIKWPIGRSVTLAFTTTKYPVRNLFSTHSGLSFSRSPDVVDVVNRLLSSEHLVTLPSSGNNAVLTFYNGTDSRPVTIHMDIYTNHPVDGTEWRLAVVALPTNSFPQTYTWYKVLRPVK